METITVGKHLCTEELKVGDEVDFFDMTCTVIKVEDKNYILIRLPPHKDVTQLSES